jgi:hypothetical protein
MVVSDVFGLTAWMLLFFPLLAPDSEVAFRLLENAWKPVSGYTCVSSDSCLEAGMVGMAASQEAGCLEHSVTSDLKLSPTTLHCVIAELPIPIILICLVPFLALLLQVSFFMPFCIK